MSEMTPETSAGGNFLTRRFAGIPGWVILAGAGLLAYWYFSHQSSTTGAQTQGIRTTGGGGTSSTGRTVVRKGAVTINVKQNPSDDNDQPTPKPPGRHHHTGGTKPNPDDVPHGPVQIDQGPAEYAIKHNRPVYIKSGKDWVKVHSTKSGQTYWVGSQVMDWLRDQGQVKGTGR